MSGRDLRGHLAWPYDEALRARHAAACARLRRRRRLGVLRDVAVTAFWLAVGMLDIVGMAKLVELFGTLVS